MSATRPSALSVNTVELKHQWAMQRNRTLVRTYLLSSSAVPLPGSWSRDDFRLPSLSRSTHGGNTMAPLSISEPSLFTPGQRAVFEGFSKNRHPLLRKRGVGPCLPSCKTPENTKTPQQSYHQVYMHFAQPLRPVPKPGQTLPRSQRRPTESRERQCKQPVNLETLSVRGTTFLSTRHSPDGASSTSRSHTHQLHVFLPAEGAGPGEDRERESVDEGFMDELDSKVNTLRARLQQYPKKPKQCDLEKSLTEVTHRASHRSCISAVSQEGLLKEDVKRSKERSLAPHTLQKQFHTWTLRLHRVSSWPVRISQDISLEMQLVQKRSLMQWSHASWKPLKKV
ncbi:hypothetical protein R3I94_019166 [Phoxinus phoxinus]